MRIAKLLRVASILVPLVGCPAPTATSEEPEVVFGQWHSLQDGVSEASLGPWKKSGFGGEGEVGVNDGSIVLPQGEPMTGITYDGEFPRENYEIEVVAARLSGTDFFCALTLPIGEQSASVVLGGWGGSLVGLSCIDGQDASQNATKSFHGFLRGQFYSLRVRVTKERIVACLDEKELLFDVPRDGHAFMVRTEVERSRPLGIASYNTRTSIRAIRWRTLEAPSKAGK